MNRKLKVTGLNPTKKGVWVHVLFTGGVVDRPLAALVEWSRLADIHREICEGTERVFLERIKAEADVQYLPLETWE